MLGTTLQRMIMWDLLKVFVITLISLTGLFLLGGLVAEASQRGLAPAQMLSIIPLMIPSMLPYTIPAATLFTTCNVYGRLAKDNEITALRAAGVNLVTILKPSLLLGVMASAATLGLYYQIIPRSFQMVREHLLGDTNELLMTMLKRNGYIKHPKLPYVLFAREVRGDRLVDAIFKRRIPKTPPGSPLQYDTVARASEAHLRVETVTDSRTGKEVSEVVVVMSNCVLCNGPKKDASPATLTVRHQEYRERLPAEVFGDKDSPRSCDVEWPELLRRAEALRQRERLRAEDIRRDEARSDQMTKAERDGLESRKWAQKFALREWRSYEAEVQTRPALALGCLCFVLAGAPIGIWANRADFLSSFVIGFLPAITFYYPMLICGTNMGKDGTVPMVPAVWAANAIFAVAALYMCRRVVRR